MTKTAYRFILALILPLALAAACTEKEPTEFTIDTESVEMGPEGGVASVRLSSPQRWVAKTQSPWITVSPANGTGPAECSIIVDSALTMEPREGFVRIQMEDSGERLDFEVKQQGFESQIAASVEKVELDSYAPQGQRHFEFRVKANVPFSVVIPEEDRQWLRCSMSELKLDRGARPRTVTVRFDWSLNYLQEPRTTTISFKATDPQQTVTRSGEVAIAQEAAEQIEIGVKGDSLALLAISRSLNCMAEFDTAERMEHWNGVEVWKSGPDKGRVRSAKFYLFATDEGLPFQVKYLTAAESLTFFGNANTFLKDLEPGEHISELEQLKRLTISAYGLVSLPSYFKKLKNLEYLDISGNNFTSVPQLINPENFPKLRALIMNANTRSTVYDLSNTVKTDLGGLIDECPKDEQGRRSFPERLLRWEKLDTLILSVNYLQGSIPDFRNDPDIPRWTEAEVSACDTLPARLIGLPKVLPNANTFSINLNRLSGELPEWLLYHPKLDIWLPDVLVFYQEGKDQDGNNAGFSNAPANLDYYYREYVNKKYNPKNQETR